MASPESICNRALQHLGASRIVSLTQDTPNARECNALYEEVRDRELRRNNWSFAIKRASLPALAAAPPFGFARKFQLPSDCLKPIRENNVDWTVEGRELLTDDGAPLNIRYVQQVTDPNTMDVLFREALAAAIAFDLCERLTQSNTKKEAAGRIYTATVAEARRVNAIEKPSEALAVDAWEMARL